MKRETNVFILLSIIVLLLSILFHSAMAGWSPMKSGSTEFLYGVWGSSPTDVFAVGENGTILHYDGDGDNDGDPDTMWERISSGIEKSLNDVWAALMLTFMLLAIRFFTMMVMNGLKFL